MRTTRMVSSFLKFNSTDAPIFGGKDRYFNGFSLERSNSDFDPKWGEIRMDVVIILIFLALQKIDDPIGHWSSQNLPGSFQDILSQCHLN